MAALRLAAALALLPHAAAARPRTFGRGIPNHVSLCMPPQSPTPLPPSKARLGRALKPTLDCRQPFTDVETEIFNHTLASGSTSGMVTHFWSTACGSGVSFKGGLDSGATIYRYYIDDEAEASVVFTPREAAGVVFDPIGECDDGECTHPAPGAAGPTPAPHGGGGGSPVSTRRDEYVVGGKGETCEAACAAEQRQCNPVINPPGTEAAELGELMRSLVEYDTGAHCTVGTQPWWAADQPSYVWAANNSNYGKCLGTVGTPATIACNGSHPLVQRLCRCGPRAPPPGQLPDKASLMTDSSAYPVGLGVAAPGAGGLDLVSAKVPWGTEWIGKTSDMDGCKSAHPLDNNFLSTDRATVRRFHERARAFLQVDPGDGAAAAGPRPLLRLHNHPRPGERAALHRRPRHQRREAAAPVRKSVPQPL